MYFLDVMKTNSAWVGLILDKDIIFVSFKLNYNGSISQTSRVKDSKYIFKERTLSFFALRVEGVLVNYENKMHARTRIRTYNHMHMYTHTYTNMHAHKDTCMHASVRSRSLAYTKYSFVIGCQSLWNHLQDTVKEVWFIELFKQILKTIVFSQSFEIPAFLNYNSALDFIWFIWCKTSSHNTPVSTCAMYATIGKVTKFMFNYLE